MLCTLLLKRLEVISTLLETFKLIEMLFFLVSSTGEIRTEEDNIHRSIFNIFTDTIEVKPTRLNTYIQFNSDLTYDKMQDVFNIERYITTSVHKVISV